MFARVSSFKTGPATAANSIRSDPSREQGLQISPAGGFEVTAGAAKD